MNGDVVIGPDGTEITLVGVGTRVIHESASVRVWDVVLPPGGVHPWHLHHNPYVVLSVAGSTGFMEWLDGSPRRDIVEYTGGSVFRPVSPIHRLTNSGTTRYRNRLIELKALGEDHPGGGADVGPGSRSVPDATDREVLGDGRAEVLTTPFVRVWLATVAAGATQVLTLDPVPHLVVALDADLEGAELDASVTEVTDGATTLTAAGEHSQRWFVVALDYLKENR